MVRAVECPPMISIVDDDDVTIQNKSYGTINTKNRRNVNVVVHSLA